MSLTKQILELGFDPADFTEEIADLRDLSSEGRTYCSYLNESMDPDSRYSHKGVFDIKVEDGKRLLMFSYNKQHGSGPMSYWWEVAFLCDGAWHIVKRTFYSYGCRHYPMKFERT